MKTTDTRIENRLIFALGVAIVGILIFAGYSQWIQLHGFFALKYKIVEAGLQVTIEKAFLQEPKIGICNEYHFVEMNFVADNDTRLKIVATCRHNNKKYDLLPVTIPFQHIYKFPVQDGEFTTDELTKVYIMNHKKNWPPSWKLLSLEFYNEPMKKFPIANIEADINAKSWLKGQVD